MPPGKGLLIAIGAKPKGDDQPDPGKEEESDMGDSDAALDAAFDALKEDDREGFKAAMRTAFMACQDEYAGDEGA